MDKERDWVSLYELIIDKGATEYSLSGEVIKSRKGTALDYSILSEAIKNHGVQYIDQLGQRLLATDGNKDDCNSKLFALNTLVQYARAEKLCVEYNPTMTDEDSALYRFGWPLDARPDFSSINPHYMTQNKQIKPLIKPTSKSTTSGSTIVGCDESGVSYDFSANDDWKMKARKIAERYFDNDTKIKIRRTLNQYAELVMEKMQELEIHGPRGRITNSNTVQREALQGGMWWGKKVK